MDDSAFERLARGAARARSRRRRGGSADPAGEGLDRFARALGRDLTRRQALALVGQAALATAAVSAGMPAAPARAAFCSTGYTDCGSVETHPDCCRSDQACCSMSRGGFCYDPLYDYCADPCGPIGIGTQCCGEIFPGSTGFTYCQVGEKCCRDAQGFAFCCPTDQDCRADHSCASCPAERDCGSTCCPPEQICTSPVAGTCAPCPAPGKYCAGHCCAGGQDCCNGVCMDVLSDEANCGSCGHTCADSGNGAGVCCNGQCCGPGLVCDDGVCLSCTSSGQCADGGTCCGGECIEAGRVCCLSSTGVSGSCAAGETCCYKPDGSGGVCAGPGETCCPDGRTVCTNGGVCGQPGDTYPCCYASQLCGGHCCIEPDRCLGGTCCPEAQICGSQCGCPAGEECRNGKCKKTKKGLASALSVLRAA